MKGSNEIFLTLAENLNFTETGKIHYVTQQNVSYHIQKLEEEFGAKLFIRKPELKLTSVGKLLYENILIIKSIEKSTKDRIKELKNEVRGEIKIGINTVRARIMLSDIFKEYSDKFPKVILSIDISDTRILEDKLTKNKVNMFIGVQTRRNKLFERKKIYNEKLYFICTKSFLKRHTKMSEDEIENSRKEGISLKDLNEVPTVMNRSDCSFNDLIELNLSRENVLLQNLIYTSDYDMQLHFCSKSIVGAFCPGIILLNTFERNLCRVDEEKVLIFKIKEIQDSLRVELVLSKYAKRTNFESIFIEKILKETEYKYKMLEKKLDKYFN